VSNLGATAVYLGFGTAAVAEKGIALEKESEPLHVRDFTGEITVIAKEGEPLVGFIEVGGS
jgi:hypothetical protein